MLQLLLAGIYARLWPVGYPQCGHPAGASTTGTAGGAAKMHPAADAATHKGIDMHNPEPSPLAFCAGLLLAFCAVLAVLWIPVIL